MASIENKALGQIIQKHRKSKNYTIPEIAEMLGVSVGFMSNLENGKNDVFKLALLSKITKTLDISLEEIATELSVKIDDISINTKSDELEIHLTNQGIENIELIKSELVLIINTFLKVLSELSFSTEATKAISKHIVDELEYIIKIKNIS